MTPFSGFLQVDHRAMHLSFAVCATSMGSLRFTSFWLPFTSQVRSSPNQVYKLEVSARGCSHSFSISHIYTMVLNLPWEVRCLLSWFNPSLPHPCSLFSSFFTFFSRISSTPMTIAIINIDHSSSGLKSDILVSPKVMSSAPCQVLDITLIIPIHSGHFMLTTYLQLRKMRLYRPCFTSIGECEEHMQLLSHCLSLSHCYHPPCSQENNMQHWKQRKKSRLRAVPP